MVEDGRAAGGLPGFIPSWPPRCVYSLVLFLHSLLLPTAPLPPYLSVPPFLSCARSLLVPPGHLSSVPWRMAFTTLHAISRWRGLRRADVLLRPLPALLLRRRNSFYLLNDSLELWEAGLSASCLAVCRLFYLPARRQDAVCLLPPGDACSHFIGRGTRSGAAKRLRAYLRLRDGARFVLACCTTAV